MPKQTSIVLAHFLFKIIDYNEGVILMKDNLTINFLIDDINNLKKHNETFGRLSSNEKYELIKDTILQSDTVVFYIMTGCFFDDTLEFPCMKKLKNESQKYKNITINYPSLGYKESDEIISGTFCYCLDISTDEKKKLFLDNYCFYERNEFLLDLPHLNTSFKVVNNRSYAPYKFYFLTSMQVKMVIEHHTREVVIV